MIHTRKKNCRFKIEIWPNKNWYTDKKCLFEESKASGKTAKIEYNSKSGYDYEMLPNVDKNQIYILLSW